VSNHSPNRLVDPHAAWIFKREIYDALGDTYLLISSGEIYMSTTNAEIATQIAGRRHDFLKPIEMYEIVAVYGPSVITTEGDHWKRQKKILAPAFSEKSNALVWEESLKQGEGLIRTWAAVAGNDISCMAVNDTAPNMTAVALHVISGAGFGVRQIWPGDEVAKLGNKIVPGFNTTALLKGHTMSLKDALDFTLNNMLLLVIAPGWLLSKSPRPPLRLNTD
jgi:hypothetical protein